MKKFLTFLMLLSIPLLAQSNSELIDLGLGGVGSISKNGQYLCGSNYPNPPFLWSESTGRIEIGNVEGEVFSVSNNGIVVGRFLDSSLTVGGDPVLRAGYFANNQWWGFEGIQGVPPLDPISFTHAYGINSEGTKAVGMVWHPNYRVEACYWSIPDIGIGLLGRTGNFNSRANVISNDGSIIAGWDGISPGPDRRAFYWDPAPHFMGGFDPTYLVGECRGMNSDGSVIVGGSVWPFIWTQANGMQHVVADSSLYFDGQAIGISDNGIIVGYVRFSVQNYQAFIKKSGWNDIILMEDYILDSLGITGYQGWYFPFGQGISADGNRIGLTAYPPGSGFAHALLLTIDTTIPVELTAFSASATGSNVYLTWSTATETNNSGFNIERSSNNSNWENIGFVPGFGTTTEPRTYSFNDAQLSPGVYSYRLKQVDFDGTFEYSDVVKVEVVNPNGYLLAQNYPNPFNPSTTIEFSVSGNELVNLTIYNLLGEKVAALVNEVLTAGQHKVNFNASGLASGIYIVKMTAGSFVESRKMNLLK